MEVNTILFVVQLKTVNNAVARCYWKEILLCDLFIYLFILICIFNVLSTKKLNSIHTFLFFGVAAETLATSMSEPQEMQPKGQILQKQWIPTCRLQDKWEVKRWFRGKENRI